MPDELDLLRGAGPRLSGGGSLRRRRPITGCIFVGLNALNAVSVARAATERLVASLRAKGLRGRVQAVLVRALIRTVRGGFGGRETPKFTKDQVENELFKLESNIVRQRVLNGEPSVVGEYTERVPVERLYEFRVTAMTLASVSILTPTPAAMSRS